MSKAGIDPQFTTLAEEFQNAGYATEMLGKWHLGSCKDEYLPNHRGFDNFNGIYFSGADHYNYESTDGVDAYDLHLNDGPDLDGNGTYSSVSYHIKYFISLLTLIICQCQFF